MLFRSGLIREGMWADAVVFDYERLEDKATWTDATASPTGIDYVLVNGQLVIELGRHTGAKPGRVLKGRGYVDEHASAVSVTSKQVALLQATGN